MTDRADENSSERREPVDIDELEIKILIIVSNENKYKGIGSFLSRRGWETIVVSDLAKAIQSIVINRPDFVLISLNHSNKKLQALPTILTQTFNSLCVMFGEQTDPKTTMALRDSKVQHKISGFVSGPGIYRALKKILQDIHNPKVEVKDVSSRAKKGSERSNMISIKGDGDSRIKQNFESLEDSVKGRPLKQRSVEGAVSQAEGDVSDATSASSKELIQQLQDQLSGTGTDKRATSGLDEKGEIRASRGDDNILSSATVEPKNSNQKGASGASGVYQEGQEQSGVDSITQKGRFDSQYDDSMLEEGKSNRKNQSIIQEGAKGKEFQLTEQAAKSQGKGSNTEEKGRTLANYDLTENSKRPKDFSENSTEEDKRSSEEFSGAAERDRDGTLERAKAAIDLSEPPSEEAKSESAKKGLSGLSSVERDQGAESAKAATSGREGPSNGAEMAMAEIDEGNAGFGETDLADQFGSTVGEIQHGKADNGSDGAEIEERAKKESRRSAKITDPLSEAYQQVEQFYSAIEETLNKISKRPRGQTKKLVKVRRVDVLVVENRNLNGYLVIAHSDNRFDHSGFAERYRSELLQLVSSEDSELKIEDHLSYNLSSVSFIEWCEQFGDFSLVLPNEGSEVGVLYVRIKEPLPELKESFSGEKIRVRVDDFNPDVALSFKAYLHLKKNEKYYLYLNEGRKISHRQRNRLMKSDHPVHIDTDDISEYKRYYIKNIIDELLQGASKQRKKKKSA